MRSMITWVMVLAAAGSCRRDEDGPRPLPDDFPVRRMAALDSALAEPDISVEYRWEVPDSLRDRVSGRDYRHVTGEVVRLSDTLAFDLDGVVAARISRAGAGSWVSLELTLPAGTRLLHTTTYHEGERMGVLVNGRLVTLATVRTPLTNMLPVVDLVPDDQARALADRINARIQAAPASSRS